MNNIRYYVDNNTFKLLENDLGGYPYLICRMVDKDSNPTANQIVPLYGSGTMVDGSRKDGRVFLFVICKCGGKGRRHQYLIDILFVNNNFPMIGGYISIDKIGYFVNYDTSTLFKNDLAMFRAGLTPIGLVEWKTRIATPIPIK